MTETPAPADVKWVIAVAGREEQIVVEAALVTNHGAAALSPTVYTIGSSSGDVILTSLHNAKGELMFQAPTLSIAYLRRYGPPEHIIQPGRMTGTHDPA